MSHVNIEIYEALQIAGGKQESSEEEWIAAWSMIIKDGIAFNIPHPSLSLQQWFIDTAHSVIKQGYVTPTYH